MPNEKEPGREKHPSQAGENFTDKLKKQFNDANVKGAVNKVREYSSKHIGDTIAYAVLLIGVLLTTFFFHAQGLFLIGIVGGFYFGEDSFAIAQGVVNVENRNRFFPSVILIGTIIAWLVVIPTFVLGFVGGFLVRKLISLASQK